jgi:hypothetical protein
MRGDMASRWAGLVTSEFERDFGEDFRSSDENAERGNGSTSRAVANVDAEVREWDDDERSAGGADWISIAGEPGPSVICYNWGHARGDPRPRQPLAPLLISEALKRLKYSPVDGRRFAGDQGAAFDAAGGPFGSAADAIALWDGWSSADSDDEDEA